VCANADTPDDATKALRHGAAGIGLCRTERESPRRLLVPCARGATDHMRGWGVTESSSILLCLDRQRGRLLIVLSCRFLVLVLADMFFSPDRIDIVREMILAQTTEARQHALDQIFVFQKQVCFLLCPGEGREKHAVILEGKRERGGRAAGCGVDAAAAEDDACLFLFL
jgi:hypothetical protein